MMNIEQEIKVLRERLDKLERQIEKEGNTKTQTRFIPNNKEEYFFLDGMGDILTSEYERSSYGDIYRVSIGNCFKTQEEAEKHKRILINTQKLKDLADKLNTQKNTNNYDIKYSIYYNKMLHELFQNSLGTRYFVQGTIYCLDENFLDKAKEEIGEEELIEIIRGE